MKQLYIPDWKLLRNLRLAHPDSVIVLKNICHLLCSTSGPPVSRAHGGLRPLEVPRGGIPRARILSGEGRVVRRPVQPRTEGDPTRIRRVAHHPSLPIKRLLLTYSPNKNAPPPGPQTESKVKISGHWMIERHDGTSIGPTVELSAHHRGSKRMFHLLSYILSCIGLKFHQGAC